jgi:hypothetical protein
VYRLQTDAGERIIGRMVSAAWVSSVLAADAPQLSAENALNALMDGRIILELAEGLQLRQARVMGMNRIELTGFTDTMVDQLKACGLFSEIIFVETPSLRSCRREAAPRFLQNSLSAIRSIV